MDAYHLYTIYGRDPEGKNKYPQQDPNRTSQNRVRRPTPGHFHLDPGLSTWPNTPGMVFTGPLDTTTQCAKHRRSKRRGGVPIYGRRCLPPLLRPGRQGGRGPFFGERDTLTTHHLPYSRGGHQLLLSKLGWYFLKTLLFELK
jgi:hypothetical protein